MSENLIQNVDLTIFRALFRARNDVFAIRWEKGKKSGYMPAVKLEQITDWRKLNVDSVLKTIKFTQLWRP